MSRRKGDTGEESVFIVSYCKVGIYMTNEGDDLPVGVSSRDSEWRCDAACLLGICELIDELIDSIREILVFGSLIKNIYIQGTIYQEKVGKESTYP